MLKLNETNGIDDFFTVDVNGQSHIVSGIGLLSDPKEVCIHLILSRHNREITLNYILTDNIFRIKRRSN